MGFILVSEVSKVSENLSRFIFCSRLFFFGLVTNKKARMRKKETRWEITDSTDFTDWGGGGDRHQELREAVTANRAKIIRRLQGESPSINISGPAVWFNAVERCYNGGCGAVASFKAGRASVNAAAASANKGVKSI